MLVKSIENEKKMRSRTRRRKHNRRIKKSNFFTDVKQNVSVVVFAQHSGLRSTQSVLKSRNQHAAKLLIVLME